MRRLIAITVGLIAGLAAYPRTITTGAQQTPTLTCSPTTLPASGPSVEETCATENFPPNSPVTYTTGATFLGSGQATTDGAGRATFAFRIPEFGVCAQLPGDLTVSASRDGAEASTLIVVTPVSLPLSCGGPAAVPAQPRQTG